MKILLLLAIMGQSKNLPLISSAILPGTGEWIMGDKKKAEVFFWVDGVLWLTYAGFTYYGKSENHSAKLFARRYAGASLSESDKYYNHLEKYDNAAEYNEDILREARWKFPDSMEDVVEKRKEYLEKYGYFGEEAWNWEPDSVRLRDYHKIRTSARGALQRASFTLGALLANRIISFIDCALFTEDKRFSKSMGFVPTLDKPGMKVVFKF